ncbi:hypothetical protein Pla52n_29560 [Stieleria varia]|uniref:Uncharacterized protein n=1 Tax=Stieleria varia TaxID=2528005 RepID=A0A5C6B018_9BACT|nr:hypothetical protein Pla52n_29560 [Stieleria varia]
MCFRTLGNCAVPLATVANAEQRNAQQREHKHGYQEDRMIYQITLYWTDGGPRKWRFQRGTIRLGSSLRLLASSTRRNFAIRLHRTAHEDSHHNVSTLHVTLSSLGKIHWILG